MASTPVSTGSGFGGLAKRLVTDGLLAPEAIQKALADSQKEQRSLISYLAANKLVKPLQLAWCVADEFGDPLFDLDSLDPESIPQTQLDEKLIRKYNALPIFKRGNRLFVAMSDPTHLDAVDAIRFNTGLNIETVAAEDNKLSALI